MTTPVVAEVLKTWTAVDEPLVPVAKSHALIATDILSYLTFSALLANVSDTWPSTVTCWQQLFALNLT